MKKNIIITLLAAATLTSCGEYNKLLKSTDYEYKYEAAKNYFAKGQYNRSATLLNELITILKGTDKAEESLYMLGMSYYNQKDYQTAAQTFITYFNTYPRGTFTELARFHAGKALFLDTPEPRLDQSSTYQAIQQLKMFMEYFPNMFCLHNAGWLHQEPSTSCLRPEPWLLSGYKGYAWCGSRPPHCKAP